MISFLCFAIGFQLMLLEILTMRGLGIVLAVGPVFLVLPAMLCGGALGAAALAKWPGLGKPLSSYTAEFSAFAALLAANALLLLPQFTEAYILAWPVLFLCLAATVVWGALFTRFLQQGDRPIRLMMFSAAGNSAAVFALPLLGYLPLPALQASGILLGLLPMILLRPKPAELPVRIGFAALLFFSFYFLVTESGRGLIVPVNIEKSYSNSFSMLEITKTPDSPYIDKRPKSEGEFDEEIIHPGKNIYSIYRNGRRATFILDALDLDELEFLRQEQPYGIYELSAKNSIAVIGAGGGQEVIQARLAGFREIAAIEINPLMIEAVQEFSRNPYLAYGAPSVKTENQDARFYFRHLPPEKKFDLIILKNVKNYGAPGIEFFNENYVFTTDSFKEYANHLNEGGLLVMKITAESKFLHVLFNTMRAGLSDQNGTLFMDHDRGSENTDLLHWKKGLLGVFHKGFLRRPLRKAIQKQFPDARAEKVFSLPAKFNPGEARISTDDRPYPLWLRTRPEVSWILPIILLAFLILLSINHGGLASPRPTNSLLMCAFLSGVGYVGSEVLFSEHILYISGDPAWAPVAVMLGFLVASIAVYAASEKFQWLREFSIAKSFGISMLLFLCWTALAQIQALPFSPRTFTLIATAMISLVAALQTILYLGIFQKITVGHNSNGLAAFMACNGLGSLAGGIIIKLVSVDGGKALALNLLVFNYIGLALVATRGFHWRAREVRI